MMKPEIKLSMHIMIGIQELNDWIGDYKSEYTMMKPEIKPFMHIMTGIQY